MEKYIEDAALHNKDFVFTDRNEAGLVLGEMLKAEIAPQSLLLAIPSGGVPVAIAVKQNLHLSLDLLLVRKIQIPWNTEAGFGAVDMDGEVVLNHTILATLGLSEEVIRSQIRKSLDTLWKRNELFRQNREFADLSGREVILIDDGLASGYTMLAAIHYVKRKNSGPITVAVPTGLLQTVEQISRQVDRLFCANIREAFPFAVAGAYKNWHDLDSREVINLLASSGPTSSDT